MPRNPTAAQKAAIEAHLRRWEPRIREAFLRAIYRARARIDVDALTDALDRGDLPGAMQILRLDRGDFSALQEAVRGAYMESGEAVTGMLPRQIAAEWGFDGTNQRAQAWIDRHGAALVQGIQSDTQAATQRAILDVLERPQERGLRSAALDITGRMNRATGRREGGILGLTAEMTDEVIRARAMLSGDLREYFIIGRDGKLRPRYARADKRFVRTVAKAWREGRTLSQAEIQRGIDLHKNKLLKERGKLISENEAFQSQAEAREEAMAQVYERPDVEDITRRWQLGFPQRHRENHVALAGQKISFTERFDLGGGILARCPHDEDLPIGETANCRCSVFYRVRLRRD